jgi:hypothetical protein
MVIHFTAIHCPPGSLKTVVSSSFDFSDPFCPLRHIKRLVTSFISFYHSSIYPSILWYVIHDNQRSRYHDQHSSLHKKIHPGAILFMLTLIRRETTLVLWGKNSFVETRIAHQPTAAEDGRPPPHSPHVHADRTENLVWLGTGRRRLIGAAVASRERAHELKERRSAFCHVAQYVIWIWLFKSKIIMGHPGVCPVTISRWG